MSEFINTNPEDNQDDPQADINFQKIDVYMQDHISKLKSELESIDMEIMDKRINEIELQNNDSQIENIESMYK